MKLYDWKSLSQGLTALYLVSFAALFLSGCAGMKQAGKYMNDPFYPEYYAAKQLDTDDIIRLRSYAASTDIKISDAASLILGRYYLKYGDRSYGEFLIQKFYNSSALNRQMMLFGKLWKMEALLANKKMAEAKAIAENVKNMAKDDVYIKTMYIFCRHAGTAPQSNDFSECLDTVVAGKAKPETGSAPAKAEMGSGSWDNISDFSYDNMTYQEYLAARQKDDNNTSPEPVLNKNSVINIIDGDLMSEFVQGMIYAINRFGSDYQINSVSGDDSAAQRFAVNIKAKTKTVDIGGTSTDMGIDWNELGYVAANMKFLADYDRVMISAPNDKIKIARDMEKSIKDTGKYVKVVNYSNPNFQFRMKNEIERSDNATFLMIGLGNDEEILDFIPIAKFLQTNTVSQRILLVVSSISNPRDKPEYAGYFRDVYILSPMQTVNNPTVNKISKDYNGFFGVDMTASNMMGYDTIVYINSLIDGEAKPEYITNITGFINYKAHRPISFYNFDKQLRFTEESPELMTNNTENTDKLYEPIGGIEVR